MSLTTGNIWESYGVPKPEKGRKREQQLKNMDQETLDKQNYLKKIINRQSARNARLKRKKNEIKLKEENQVLREENENLKEENKQLKEKIKLLNTENANLENNESSDLRIKLLEEEVLSLKILNNELYSESLRFNCFLN